LLSVQQATGRSGARQYGIRGVAEQTIFAFFSGTMTGTPPAPRILHADCDAMFCAVARLVDPEGAGKAEYLIVGGRRGSRGVVLSASYEARALGVRSGMPITRAERLCPGAVFAPVPRGVIGEKSREVREVLEEWAPVVEPASVDEFYLSLDGTEALYRHEPLERTAHRIRDDVLARTGMTVSFGGGSNRLIAKLAVERAKPRPGGSGGGTGVHIVPPGAEGEFVAGLDLSAIPGIGPRFTESLHRKGLVRAADVLPFEVEILQHWFGARTGRWLYDRVRGVGRATVEGGGDAKSVSRESTFAEDLETDYELETRLVGLTAKVCRDLRSSGLRARTVTVKLRDFDFRTRSASRTLADPVSSDRAILPVAQGLFHDLRERRRVPARLLGVGFSHLGDDAPARQLGLFGDPAPVETERDRTVAAMVDRIRGRWGTEAIGPARLVEPEE